MQIPADFNANKTNYRYLVAHYQITPIRQFKLLSKKPAKGLYRKLTDVVYQFTAVSKKGGAPFWFNTGYYNGDKLLAALNKTMPPLESWAATPAAQPQPGPGPAVPPGPPGPAVPGATCPFNTALLQLLNLFFLKHAFDPLLPSGQMYIAINQNPQVPQTNAALGANTILVRFGETAQGLVAWLQAEEGAANVRTFDFTILTNHLNGLQPKPTTIAI